LRATLLKLVKELITTQVVEAENGSGVAGVKQN